MVRLNGMRHIGGKTGVQIRYIRDKGESGLIELGSDWRINPEQPLFDELSEEIPTCSVRYHYDTTSLHRMIPQKSNFGQKVAINQ